MKKARIVGVLAVLSIATLVLAQGPGGGVPASVTPAMGGFARFASGGSGTPSISFVANPFDGLFWGSAGHILYTSNGNATIDFGTGITLGSTSTLGFSSTASPASQSPGDTVFTRVQAGTFGWTAVLFANLLTPANGSFAYCSDCTIATPCAGGGTGALAKRLNAVWVCN
jgi:hypothetical protein